MFTGHTIDFLFELYYSEHVTRIESDKYDKLVNTSVNIRTMR